MTTESVAVARRSSALLICAAVAVAVVGIVLAENLGAGILYEILLRLPGIDKVMHLVQYTAVFFAFWWAAGRLGLGPWPRIATAIGCGMALGLLDETVQRTLAKRTFELEDMAVDLAALLAGAAIVAPVCTRALRVAVILASLTTTGLLAWDTHRHLVHYNRALLHERRHELKEARDEYLKALESGHRTPGVYNSLAWVEIESGVGDAAAAVRYASIALAARPRDADTLDTYGWALQHVGRSSEALDALQRARALKPGIYCVEYHLGVVLASLARPCEARAAFERQIARFPNALEARRAAEALTRIGCAPGSDRTVQAR